MPDEGRQAAFHVARLEDNLVVLGAELVRHRLCLGPFVGRHLEAEPGRHVEADGERIHVRQRLGGQGGDAPGVHPAAQVRADGDVAHELAADRLPEEPVELLLVLRVRRPSVVLLAEVEIPVLMRLHRTAFRAHREMVAGAQEPYVGKQRPVGEDVLEREVLEQMGSAQAGAQRVVLEHRLDLGAEQEGVREVRVVERLDAEAVAREEQLARARRPRSRARTCR